MGDVYNMAHLNPGEEPSHTEQVLKSEVTKTTKLFQNWCRDGMFPEDGMVPKIGDGSNDSRAGDRSVEDLAADKTAN